MYKIDRRGGGVQKSYTRNIPRFLDTDKMQFVSFFTELIAKSNLAKEFVNLQQQNITVRE